MEFEGALSKKMDANPVAVVEALIHINNQLHQHEVCWPYKVLIVYFRFDNNTFYSKLIDEVPPL